MDGGTGQVWDPNPDPRCPPILACQVMNRARTCRPGVHHEPPHAGLLCSHADPVLESTRKHLSPRLAPQISLHQAPSAFGKPHLHLKAQILRHLPGTGQTLGGPWHPESSTVAHAGSHADGEGQVPNASPRQGTGGRGGDTGKSFNHVFERTAGKKIFPRPHSFSRLRGNMAMERRRDLFWLSNVLFLPRGL